jgi:hypothetical protein
MVYTDEQRAHDRRLLGSRFQDCCRTTRDGGGTPEREEGDERGIRLASRMIWCS